MGMINPVLWSGIAGIETDRLNEEQIRLLESKTA